MATETIPNVSILFNRPYVDGRVLENIKKVIETGKISGDGPMCKAVEAQIKELFSVKHALLTTSCTHALETAMMMLDLQPGDEVITPSFTFVSTANAIIRGGGKPVFCDINDRTQTIDVNDFERRITKKTKAVIPVHYAGVSAEMDEILEIARAHRLVVVEDAAQGVNAKYKGRFLGTIGDASAYSFHDTKNYVSGEGGAFTTNNDALARKAEIIREKGTNRSNFLRGEVDKYTWVDHGSSYILSDILAAILKSQLDDLDEIQAQRKRVHDGYMRGLAELERQEKLRLPVIPSYCESNYHIFYILLRSEEERVRVTKQLKEFGISATFHYVPLHSSPYALKALGTRDLKLPVTDHIYSTLLRLPIYPQLRDAEVEYVVGKLREILK
ncbi:MAG: dTDP-4-amino-4,6-dideoxygalactose transaminase [Ignavibacteria bacterium]|nr:dTDP-4-amino-4,6-dideoxygalactose transaminase [Ignavibacteria bacterium]MBI3765726.1 dTDP-4-amino-4,6-dideoxygalactose transaminase [Ignavibacteriales bacterium]